MSTDHPHRLMEAFFGRRKGKTLSPLQIYALENTLPQLRVDTSKPAPQTIDALFDANYARHHLEIGFGGGEHLLHRASEAPQTGFIGVEPFVNGLAKCVSTLSTAPMPNVRLFDDDATVLLDWLPSASLDQVDLLYPDPWPKKKHWKRRFVNQGNLERIVRVLKKGGQFCFASDIDTYVNWTLLHCRRHSAFAWQASAAGDWQTPYEGWPGTRYEAKAFREGRTPAYLTFIRL